MSHLSHLSSLCPCHVSVIPGTSFLIPRLSRRWHLARGVGQSERVCAMTHKAITLKFVVPTMLAIALGIMLSIDAVYLTVKYLVLIDQSEVNHSAAGSRGIAELPNPDGRLSRVHLLLSRTK
jgi:hypothetical protein